MKYLVTLVVASACVAAGFWYWNAPRDISHQFRTAKITRGDIVVKVSATGTIEPEELVDVGAQVAGRIQAFGSDPADPKLPINYGSHVEEGTILARIEDALFKSRVEQMKANLRRAEADLEQFRSKQRQTDRDWKRAQKLREQRAISETDLDLLLANLEVAQANLGVGQAAVSQGKASLDEAQINLGYTTIRSPVKGVIIDRRVNVGQTVVASLNAPSLFLIAKDLSRMEVWASVNEADIGRIYQGQTVRFTVDAYPDDVFVGKVSQIRLNATMTQNVVTYTVVVGFDNSGEKLLPYLTANLQFVISEHLDVLSVPNAALRWRPRPEQIDPAISDGRPAAKMSSADIEASAESRASTPVAASSGTTLWIERSNLVRPVEVQLGASDGVRTEIRTDQLKEGDAIVVGEVIGGAGENSAANPFLPQRFGKNKNGKKDG